MSHWIVIADASGARIVLAKAHNKPLVLVQEHANPKGRMRTQDLTSDGPGRMNKSGTPGTKSATSPHTTAHDVAAEEFARQLAASLRHDLDKGSFTSLAISAPPHFLGLIRSLLDKEVQQRLVASLPRDLIHVSIGELPPHLRSLIPAGLSV